ncbi:MAG: two-component system response regulator [Alphaproteobacteria bacterium]|nr:MAG: two-component system response regulator [Caulobacteraceae bacterium]TPW02467.1 MAG: two-component system response regulator [Alphaproteobacteria bacterium]
MPYSKQHSLQTSDIDAKDGPPLDRPVVRSTNAAALHESGEGILDAEATIVRDAYEAAHAHEDGVLYLEDPMDRLRADWFARRNGGARGGSALQHDIARTRVAHAIHLTESALIEISLAGLRPELIHCYLGMINELHALRDGRQQPAATPRIADRRVAHARVDPTGSEVRKDYIFTPRQKAVVDLLLTGASTRKIAAGLELAEGTVKIHLAAIYRTLGVRSRAEAIARLK